MGDGVDEGRREGLAGRCFVCRGCLRRLPQVVDSASLKPRGSRPGTSIVVIVRVDVATQNSGILDRPNSAPCHRRQKVGTRAEYPVSMDDNRCRAF
jgi:hypothetical protein